MTASMQKTLAALNLPTQNPALLGVARAIVQAMIDNPSFPSPTPSLAKVAAALSALEAAEVATQTKTRGTAVARNEKRAVLVGLLVQVKAYVQGVADEDPDGATGIIESAGMSIKKKVLPFKAPFEVRPGSVSGSVRIVARAAAHRASYQWAWSADGGRTWISEPTTLKANTAVSGLPAGSTCSFRHRVVTRAGERDWSEAVSTLVR
jgi:hypothetical protein